MSHSTQIVLNLFAWVSALVLYTFLFGLKGAEVTNFWGFGFFFCNWLLNLVPVTVNSREATAVEFESLSEGMLSGSSGLLDLMATFTAGSFYFYSYGKERNSCLFFGLDFDQG